MIVLKKIKTNIKHILRIHRIYRANSGRERDRDCVRVYGLAENCLSSTSYRRALQKDLKENETLKKKLSHIIETHVKKSFVSALRQAQTSRYVNLVFYTNTLCPISCLW